MRSQVERIIRLHENEIFFVCGAFSGISANTFDVIIFIIFFTDAFFRKRIQHACCLPATVASRMISQCQFPFHFPSPGWMLAVGCWNILPLYREANAPT